MTCDEIRREVASEPGGTLGAHVAREIDDHLGACEACELWLGSNARLSRVLATIGDEEVSPDFTQRVMTEVRLRAEGATRPSPVAPSRRWRRLAAHGALGVGALAAGLVLASMPLPAVVVPSAPWLDVGRSVGVTVPTFADLATPLRAALGRLESGAGVAAILSATLLVVTNLILGGVRPRGATIRTLSVGIAGAALLVAPASSAFAAVQEPGSQAPPPELYQSLRESADAERLLALVLLSVGIGIGLAALGLLLRTYASKTMPKIDHVVRERSGTYQLFVGACDAILLFILVVACAGLGPLRVVSFLVLGAVYVLAGLGFAARARAVGRDVLALGGAVRPELTQTLVGSAALIALLAFPVVGQIVWCGLLAQCLGTAFLGLLRRAPKGPSV